MATASPNQISALISAWFGSTPSGLFGAVQSESDLTVTKDPRVVEWLDTAIAICLAESQGNPDAKSPISSASGLWQIMVSAHKDKIADGIRWLETETGESGLTIFDARVNTYVAGQVYKEAGNKWTPWEAYNKGAYLKYKGKGSKAFDWLNNESHIKKGIESLEAERIRGEAVSGLAGLAAGPLVGAAGQISTSSIVTSALKFLREAGVTIGVFLLAIVMLILGVAIFASTIKPVKQAVKKAVPVV